MILILKLRRIISIHALHEESDPDGIVRCGRTSFISIHALHEESDGEWSSVFVATVISIHALHEESDTSISPRIDSVSVFQSTLSMRRATRLETSGLQLRLDFNPRSP